MSAVDFGLALLKLGGSYYMNKQQQDAAEDAAASNAKAAGDTYNAAMRDLARQTDEAIDLGEEEKSDLIRQMDREMSTMRVAAVESGASLGMTQRFATELGFLEGLGLSRIDKNTMRALRAIDSAADRAKVDLDNQLITNANQLVAARRATNMNFLGTGLATVGSLYGTYANQTLAKNSGQPSLSGFGDWLINW